MMCLSKEESEKHTSKLFDELTDNARSLVQSTIRSKLRWKSTSEQELDAQPSEISSAYLKQS